MTESSAQNKTSAAPSGCGPLVWMILTQLLGLLSLIPWFFAAVASVMSYDKGVTFAANLLAAAVWSYPLLPVGCSILAWILYALKRRRAAVVVTTLPVLLVLLGGCFFGLFMMPSLIATPGQMIIRTIPAPR